jgi:imidazole glycerol phosphate synthase glutamine amidotransferase subunit
MSRRVAVVPVGASGTASLLAALARCGAHAFVTLDPREVEQTTFLALAGTGGFDRGMEQLRSAGLADLLRKRVEHDRPTLAVATGMHVLFESSDLHEGAVGIGAVPGAVGPLPPGAVCPHIGWNEIVGEDSAMPSGLAYFAHCAAVSKEPEGWLASWTDHGGPIVAALQRGTVLGCQFRPELSGVYGDRALRTWLMEAALW